MPAAPDSAIAAPCTVIIPLVCTVNRRPRQAGSVAARISGSIPWLQAKPAPERASSATAAGTGGPRRNTASGAWEQTSSGTTSRRLRAGASRATAVSPSTVPAAYPVKRAPAAVAGAPAWAV